jgi:hypothetical protein
MNTQEPKVSTRAPKAPYVSKGYISEFLSLIKRVRVTEVTGPFLLQSGCASPGNESKTLSALRFLNILNPDGTVNTEVMSKLRLDGDESKQALHALVSQAYHDLFHHIDIAKATAIDLRNYFVRKYDYAQSQAQQASILFIYLCDISGISYSEELSVFSKTTAKPGQQRPKRTEKSMTQTDQTPPAPIPVQPNMEMTDLPENAFEITVKGKKFHLKQIVHNSKELEKCLKTIEINCDFEE